MIKVRKFGLLRYWTDRSQIRLENAKRKLLEHWGGLSPHNYILNNIKVTEKWNDTMHTLITGQVNLRFWVK
jgi:hypothetical protein